MEQKTDKHILSNGMVLLGEPMGGVESVASRSGTRVSWLPSVRSSQSPEQSANGSGTTAVPPYGWSPSASDASLNNARIC